MKIPLGGGQESKARFFPDRRLLGRQVSRIAIVVRRIGTSVPTMENDHENAQSLERRDGLRHHFSVRDSEEVRAVVTWKLVVGVGVSVVAGARGLAYSTVEHH